MPSSDLSFLQLVLNASPLVQLVMATLVLAYALEEENPEMAETVRRCVRGFSSIAAFLSDEWSINFIDPLRHETLKQNFGKLGDAAEALGSSPIPSPRLMEVLAELFDQYFWAA